MPATMPDIGTTLNGHGHGHDQNKSAAKESFYRLGNAGGNLSNTSLESAALLDHR